MTDYVLVHGAWGGSWGFGKIRPLLTAAGHQVFTPSLTGIGERQHLANPEVGLSTHIQDVANMAYYEDLDDLVLLGFSYGGMVVSGALDVIGERVRHFVLLDAFLPSDGDSVSTLTGMVADPDQWTIPPMPRQLGDDTETAWANERRSPQPVATFTEPVRISQPIESWSFGRTYIKATADENESPDSPFWQASAKTKASEAWSHHEIACNHMIPLMEPQLLTTMLLELS